MSEKAEVGSFSPAGDGAPLTRSVFDHQTPPVVNVTAEEHRGEMLDVRIPHVHAPHGEIGGWRGFATHVAVIAVGLLLAFGLEQTAEYVHHEIQRTTLEAQMRETFQSNLGWASSNIRVLDADRAYLIELRNAVNSRIAGGHEPAPESSDPRNIVVVPPPDLGSYEASKLNGSINLLGLNRARVYSRIEFQQSLMLNNFRSFYDTVAETRSFADRNSRKDEDTPGRVAQPDIDRLSPAELFEYRALLTKLIQYNRQYSRQLQNLKGTYRLMLNGVDNVDTLINAITRRKTNQ